MIRKTIIALGLGVFLSFGLIHATQTQQNPNTSFQTQETVSYLTVVAICNYMAKDGITDCDTALNWSKTGAMTISKIGSGSYKVNYPGGGILVDILDTSL